MMLRMLGNWLQYLLPCHSLPLRAEACFRREYLQRACWLQHECRRTPMYRIMIEGDGSCSFLVQQTDYAGNCRMARSTARRLMHVPCTVRPPFAAGVRNACKLRCIETNEWQNIGGEMREMFISLHVTPLCASWAVLPGNLIRKAGLQVYAQRLLGL